MLLTVYEKYKTGARGKIMDMAVLITVRGRWDCLFEICCSRHNALNVGIEKSNVCQLSTCLLGGNLLEFECFCHFNLIVLDKPAQEEEKQQKVNKRSTIEY